MLAALCWWSVVCQSTNVKQVSGGIFYEPYGTMKLSDTTWKIVVEIELKEIDIKIGLIEDLAKEIKDTCQRKSLEKVYFPAGCKTIETIAPELLGKIKLERSNIKENFRIRNRRALINGLGSIIKKISGNMDDDDFKDITTKLEFHEKSLDKVKNLIRHQIQTMSLQSEAINNTIGEIDYNRQLIANQTRKINELIPQLKSGDFNNKHLELEGLVEGQIGLFTLLCTILLDELDDIRELLLDAKQNLLNTNIISFNRVLERLMEASPHLPDGLTFPFKLIFEDVVIIEKIIGLNIIIIKDVVMLIMEIPLVKNEFYNVLKMYPIPEKLTENVFAVINVQEEFLVINKDKTIYLEMSNDKLKDCKNLDKSSYICKNKISRIRTGRSKNCEVEIFIRRNNTYPDFCKTSIFKLDEPKIIELKDKNSILIICPRNETAELECENEHPIHLNLWNASVIYVNKSCNFHIGNTEVNFREKNLESEPIKHRQIEFDRNLLEKVNFSQLIIEKLPTIVRPVDFKNFGSDISTLMKEMDDLDSLKEENILKHPNIIVINVMLLLGVLYLIVRTCINMKKKKNPEKRIKRITGRVNKKNNKLRNLRRKLRKSLEDVEVEDIEIGNVDGNEDVPN